MPMVDDRASVFLSLDTLTPNRDVALALPRELARRFRALPIAQDSGRITVVMADPGDQDARNAVTAALTTQPAGIRGGISSVYVVQGDPVAIDAWLAELWPADEGRPGQQVWLREPLQGDKERVLGFAQDIASLLGAPLSRFCPTLEGPLLVVEDSSEVLVILPCVDANLRHRLLWTGEGRGSAVLFACQVRWPLRKLLVITRGDQVDELVLAWAARLARPTGAAVTALMVAPSVHGEALDEGILAYLAATNALGRKMRQAAEHLATLQLDATLHLRQGAPETVIREELAAGDYDLAITGLVVRGGEARWRLRPFLDPLLQDVRCPLLVVQADAERLS